MSPRVSAVSVQKTTTTVGRPSSHADTAPTRLSRHPAAASPATSSGGPHTSRVPSGAVGCTAPTQPEDRAERRGGRIHDELDRARQPDPGLLVALVLIGQPPDDVGHERRGDDPRIPPAPADERDLDVIPNAMATPRPELARATPSRTAAATSPKRSSRSRRSSAPSAAAMLISHAIWNGWRMSCQPGPTSRIRPAATSATRPPTRRRA